MWRKISLRNWIIMSQLQIKLTAPSAKLPTFSFYIKLGNTFQGNIFSFLFLEVRQPLQQKKNVSE